MKKKLSFILAALMAFTMMATACNDKIEGDGGEGDMTLPTIETTTAAPVTEPATEATPDPIGTTVAPETEAPAVTDAPATEAPKTDAPATEAPKTEAPVTTTTVATTTPPPTTTAPIKKQAKYVYNLLSADEKYLYDTIKSGVENFETTITFKKKYDGEMVYNAWKNVFYQEPQLFWLKGTLSKGYSGESVSPDYLYTRSEAAVMQPKIDTAVKNLLDSLPANASMAQKLTIIHDKIALKADYTMDAKSAPTIYGPLVGGYAQCAGYAKAMFYMCEQLGVEVTHVAGHRVKDNASHAWVKVKLDGKWYNIDLTWDDPMGKDDKTFFVHHYLLIPDSQLSHIVDDTYTPPKANSLDKNYFVLNGLYVTKSSQTLGIMKSQLQKAADGKKSVAEFKCSSQELWNDARVKLAQNQAQLIKDINASSKYKVAKITDYSKPDTLTIQINIEYK